MNEINQIKNHIADFCKEGYIDNKDKEMLLCLAKRYAIKEKEVEKLIQIELEAVKKAQVDKLFRVLDQPAAAIRSTIDCEIQNNRQFPDLINIGKLKMTSFDNSDAMALLPTKDIAGTCFLHSGDEKGATSIMQNIAIRLALSLPSKKVKFTLVDIEQSGLAFSYLSGLDEELYTIVDSTKQLDALYETMVKESSSFIFKELGNKYENYHDYFLVNKNVAKPYHIILVNGISGKISEELIPNFIKIINFATKTGVFFLLSFDTAFNNSVYSQYDELQACLCEKMFVIDLFDNTCKSSNPVINLWYNKVYVIEPTNTIEFDDFQTDWINHEYNPIKHKKPNKTKHIDKPQPSKDSIQHILLLLGLNKDSELFECLFDDAHEDSLILSSDASSKNTIFQHIAYSLAKNYQHSELQLKCFGINRESLELIKSLPHSANIVANSSPVYFDGFIQDLSLEIDRRKNLFKDAPVKISGYSEYRKVTGEKLPRIFVLVQDFDKTISQASDLHLTELMESLSHLMTECNGFGIHFMIFSNPDEKILYLDLNQFEYRLFIKSDVEKSKLFANLSSSDEKILSDKDTLIVYSNSSREINHCMIQPEDEKSIKEELLKMQSIKINDLDDRFIINSFENQTINGSPYNNIPVSEDGTINIFIGQSLWYTKDKDYLLTLPKNQSPNIMISGNEKNVNMSFLYSTLKQLGDNCEIAIFDVTKSMSKESANFGKAQIIIDNSGFINFVAALKEKTESMKMNPGIVSPQLEPLMLFVFNVDSMFKKEEFTECFKNIDFLLQNSNELNVRVAMHINDDNIFDDEHLSMLSKYTFGTNIICQNANENLLSPLTTMDNKLLMPSEDYFVLIETPSKKSDFSADPVKLYNL